MIARKHLEALLDTMHAALDAMEPNATNVEKLTARAALLMNSWMLQRELAEEARGRGEALAAIQRATEQA